VTLSVWASPGARRSDIVGEADGSLRVRLAAPAHEGRANAELVRFIAARLEVPRGAVTLVTGASARRKVLRVSGITEQEARRRLRL
jgi:uncharacterized protein (TIGR00251 family)